MTERESYHRENKAAWEEAFDHRLPEYGANMAQRLQTEQLPYFTDEERRHIGEIGIQGRRVAQLCCNNGREALSLAAAGAAEVVGFDIAENMVAFASGVAAQTGLPARFVQTDIYEIPGEYDGSFDMVLVTVGALNWFEDLDRFFAVAARLLQPGGVLLMEEIHPVENMMCFPGEPAFEATGGKGGFAHSYFKREPFADRGMGYMSGGYENKTFYDYSHPLGETITAIAKSGFLIELLEEYQHDVGLGDFYDDWGIPQTYVLRAKRLPG